MFKSGEIAGLLMLRQLLNISADTCKLHSFATFLL